LPQAIDQFDYRAAPHGAARDLSRGLTVGVDILTNNDRCGSTPLKPELGRFKQLRLSSSSSSPFEIGTEHPPARLK
jgi:hypothetical protein